MSEHYEDEHLRLREQLAQRGAAYREGELDGSEVIAANRLLEAFEGRTGPLVDELVAAARDMEGELPRDRRLLTTSTWAKLTALREKLAALDEASRDQT